ncbi:MAG: hypothetical protein LBH62_00180 [Nitrososphaerota archaeon]|nr:hypothetical protein [Nitrososphaerota archaeon]
MSMTECMVHVPNAQPENYLKENKQLKAILSNEKYRERLRVVLTWDEDELIDLDKLDLSQAIMKAKTWFEKKIAYSNEFDKKYDTKLSEKFRVMLVKNAAPRMKKDRGMSLEQTREVLLFWIAFYSVLRLFEGKEFGGKNSVFHLGI